MITVTTFYNGANTAINRLYASNGILPTVMYRSATRYTPVKKKRTISQTDKKDNENMYLHR